MALDSPSVHFRAQEPEPIAGSSTSSDTVVNASLVSKYLTCGDSFFN